MLKILNTEEAKRWSEENLYEADMFLSALDAAVKSGLLIEIDNGYFAVKETEWGGCTWVIDSIRRLSDKEMRDGNLFCRYRYTEHVIQKPEHYQGEMENDAGFNLPGYGNTPSRQRTQKTVTRGRSL